jgi:8-oxo-dGTP pyrophosphatase MutT (NUDIX family)
MRDALFREIRAYQPEDAAEADGRNAVLDLLSLDDFASRNHFEPGHITASGFIVDAGGARVLLHHHRRLNRWLQMGGHLEPGETPTAAALREAGEESGLSDLFFLRDAIFDLDVHVIPAFGAEPGHRHFDLRYLLSTNQPDRIAIDNKESLSLAWFSLDDAVVAMDEACSRRAIGKIRRMFGRQ